MRTKVIHKRVKLSIIICVLFISILILLFCGYKMIATYYSCHPLPGNVVMRQLNRANGQDIELFGKIISPATNEQGNIIGYSEMVGYCE